MRFDFSKIDVEEFLSELGITYKKKGRDYWFSCPLPRHVGVDHTPSISMEEGTTRVYCFGCKFGGNAVTFLSELEDVTPLKAKQWIRERFNVTTREPAEGFGQAIVKKINRMRNRPEKSTKIINYSTIPEEELEKRLIDWTEVDRWWKGKIEGAYPFAYMLDRGFDPNILNEWAFGWDMISERICFPIRDEEGNLVGLKGRTTNPEERSRYLVLGGPDYGFETYNVSRVLYGLDRVGEQDELIVVEGEFNVLMMHQNGYHNVVGLPGKNLSIKQINLIKKYANSVSFLFDDFKDTYDAAKVLEPFMPVKLIPDHDEDPADMDKIELDELVSSRSSVLSATIREAIENKR